MGKRVFLRFGTGFPLHSIPGLGPAFNLVVERLHSNQGSQLPSFFVLYFFDFSNSNSAPLSGVCDLPWFLAFLRDLDGSMVGTGDVETSAQSFPSL